MVHLLKERFLRVTWALDAARVPQPRRLLASTTSNSVHSKSPVERANDPMKPASSLDMFRLPLESKKYMPGIDLGTEERAAKELCKECEYVSSARVQATHLVLEARRASRPPVETVAPSIESKDAKSASRFGKASFVNRPDPTCELVRTVSCLLTTMRRYRSVIFGPTQTTPALKRNI